LESGLTDIYLDHAATTPMRPEVWEAMRPYLQERFGNPSSLHRWGREARGAIEESRERVASALGARRGEIVFTGGGTEADNLAVLGSLRALRGTVGAGAVACSAIEHKAVLAAVKHAAHEGAEMVLIGVDTSGLLDLGALDEVLRARPAVVSVMWVNNEVGVVQPVQQVAERCRDAGVLFHSDAVQAFGKVRVDMSSAACDLLTVSAHKLGGPKGLGALFIRQGVKLEALVHGGGQERGFRPGTENVASVVGFAVAAELAVRDHAQEGARLARLRDLLVDGLRAAIPDTILNGAETPAQRAPHIVNLSFAGVDQDMIVLALDMDGVAVSSGSACQSGATEPSHVLVAMGRADPAEASVRFSLGHTTTEEDVRAAVQRIPVTIERVRSFTRV
jgi:cysteine desulfurase